MVVELTFRQVLFFEPFRIAMQRFLEADPAWSRDMLCASFDVLYIVSRCQNKT